jgi:hypothetical protein
VKNVKKRPIVFTSPKIMRNYVAFAVTSKIKKRINLKAISYPAMTG